MVYENTVRQLTPSRLSPWQQAYVGLLCGNSSSNGHNNVKQTGEQLLDHDPFDIRVLAPLIATQLGYKW